MSRGLPDGALLPLSEFDMDTQSHEFMARCHSSGGSAYQTWSTLTRRTVPTPWPTVQFRGTALIESQRGARTKQNHQSPVSASPQSAPVPYSPGVCSGESLGSPLRFFSVTGLADAQVAAAHGWAPARSVSGVGPRYQKQPHAQRTWSRGCLFFKS